ncbi:hypothetical protein BH09ACT6_BH09ACT6_10990 [soil metagenome]
MELRSLRQSPTLRVKTSVCFGSADATVVGVVEDVVEVAAGEDCGSFVVGLPWLEAHPESAKARQIGTISSKCIVSINQ